LTNFTLELESDVSTPPTQRLTTGHDLELDQYNQQKPCNYIFSTIPIPLKEPWLDQEGSNCVPAHRLFRLPGKLRELCPAYDLFIISNWPVQNGAVCPQPQEMRVCHAYCTPYSWIIFQGLDLWDWPLSRYSHRTL